VSEPVREIGGQDLGPRVREAWLIRHGMWILLSLIVVIFAAAAVTPYHGVVTAPVRFAAAGAVTAPAGGRVHLLVREGEVVRDQQPIAVVEAHAAASRSTVVFVPRGSAASIRRGDQATVELADGRRLPAVIEEILPAEGERLPLRVRLERPAAGAVQGTLAIRLAATPLIHQLSRSPH
jgi:hypothetical protein